MDESTLRERMVSDQIVGRGVSDRRVLEAMRAVPRHLFVPDEHRQEAYEDYPLPIGSGQTISQPYIVAYMTEHLRLSGSERVLEIGTGSGYQAAVLGALAADVCTMEIHEVLFRRARRLLLSLGYGNIHCVLGDGSLGMPEEAPFDRIILTAAAPEMPEALIAQLAPEGTLLMPLGSPHGYQQLVLVRRRRDGRDVRTLSGVRFVPMTGRIARAPGA